MLPVKPNLRRDNVMLSPFTVSIWHNRAEKVYWETIREEIYLKIQFFGITWESGFSITIKSVEVSIQFVVWNFMPLIGAILLPGTGKFSQKYQSDPSHPLASVFGAWSPNTEGFLLQSNPQHCHCYSSCHVLRKRENLCHIPEFRKEEGTQESYPLSKLRSSTIFLKHQIFCPLRHRIP